ncbi:MAG: hypothetical protein IPK00_10505 [Deltaproteobacteria bacterium]|nr:hypothetical protein [Deltaproteobacteria bacterium]
MGGTSVAGATPVRAGEGLVRDLLKAVEDSGAAADDRIDRFRREYVGRFDESWRSFLLSTATSVRPKLDVLDSPYLELFDRVTEEISVELPRDEARPEWMALALRIRGEVSKEGVESSEEESPKDASESWDRYQAALDQVSAEVGELTPQDSDEALKTALSMSGANSFGAALSLIEELVP